MDAEEALLSAHDSTGDPGERPAKPPARRTNPDHIGPLDGLRALAIVLVLLFHLTPGANPDLGLMSIPAKIASAGWSGVDLFFVLSGFLITTRLQKARRDPHRFRNFYVRRALRIVPLYYATLAVVLLVLPAVAASLRVPPLREQLPYWLYYANFVEPDVGLGEVVSLGHFWSLAIEEQFYLVWPAVVFLSSDRTVRRLSLFMLCVAPLFRFVLASAGAPWMSTYSWAPSRLDGLAAGALAAVVYADRDLRPWLRRAAYLVGAITLPVAAWLTWTGRVQLVMTSVSTPGAIAVRALTPSVMALLFAALMVWSLEVRRVGRIFTGPAQTALARYSYGLYVFHFLLVPAATRILRPHLRAYTANSAAFLFFAVTAGASLLLAVISYHAFERYFLQLKRRFPEGHHAEIQT